MVEVGFWGASVKVFCACQLDDNPTAVSENLTFASCRSVTKLLSEMFPKASAVTVYGPWVSISGDSTSVNATVSAGCHPDPVILTVVPGG